MWNSDTSAIPKKLFLLGGLESIVVRDHTAVVCYQLFPFVTFPVELLHAEHLCRQT